MIQIKESKSYGPTTIKIEGFAAVINGAAVIKNFVFNIPMPKYFFGIDLEAEQQKITEEVCPVIFIEGG